MGLGEWLRKYGEAIYKTRVCAPYKAENIYYTQTNEAVYAIAKNYNSDYIPYDGKISEIEVLNTGKCIEFTQCENKIILSEQVTTGEEFTVFKLSK